VDQNCRPQFLLEVQALFLLIINDADYRESLSIDRAEQVNVPQMLGLLLRLVALFLVAHVCDILGSVAQCFADYEWSFPWRGQLVYPLRPLDESHDQVTLLEGSTFDSVAIVATQALLVDGCLG
jgi:hypothetical protein